MSQLSWKKLLSTETEKTRTTDYNQKDRDSYDGRTPYDSDYDRIIFSYPFRRLQDKAQLFPLESNDFVRTRLTHSLEVAALAKSIGISLAKQINEKFSGMYGWDESYMQTIPTVLECAGLVHDLGNPPFGHYGEETIGNSLYSFYKSLSADKNFKEACNGFTEQQKKDIEKFEGNSQSFRILTHLQCIKDEYGYHMTSALLASIMKYPVDSNNGNDKNNDDIRKHKFGYFYPETETAKNIFEKTGLIDIDENKEISFIRHPLAFLMEAADDLAYCAGDIEDGFKKGLFTFTELINEFEEYNKKYNDIVIYELTNSIKDIQKSSSYYSEEKKIQDIRIQLQKTMFHSIIKSFIENYDSLMSGTFNKELIKVSDAHHLRECLKTITKKYLFSDKNVIAKELMGKEIIEYLVKLYTTGLFQINNENKSVIKFDDRIKKLIASDYLEVFKKASKCNADFDNIEIKTDNIYYMLLLIADQISGMTDTYCMSLYKKLNAI